MAENSGHEQPMPLGVAQSDEGQKKKKKIRKGESRSQTNKSSCGSAQWPGRKSGGRGVISRPP